MSNAARRLGVLQEPRREVATTLGKFGLMSLLGMVVWIIILAIADGGVPDVTASEVASDLTSPLWWDGLLSFAPEITAVVLALLAPGFLAGVLYFQFPDTVTNRWQKYGQLFAMFMAVNVTVSTAFLIFIHTNGGEANSLTGVIDIIGMWALGSILIPGPYAGVLIAARWSA